MSTPELHPLCALFPRLEGDSFEKLKADIAAHGQREPVVLHKGKILDGGNRYRACRELGQEPRTTEFQSDDAAGLAAYVLSANLHRRHLMPGQQAAIVSAAQNWTRANGRGGDRRSDQSATLHFDSVAERAATSGASIRTQKMADKVAREAPDLARQVAHGNLSLPAAVKQISPSQTPRTTAAPNPRIAALEAQVKELEDELHTAHGTIADLGAQVEAAQTVLSGDAAKRILQLEGQRATVEQRRDDLMTENAQLKREVAALRRRLGE